MVALGAQLNWQSPSNASRVCFRTDTLDQLSSTDSGRYNHNSTGRDSYAEPELGDQECQRTKDPGTY